ncbi:MAG: hypothetical protein K6F39_08290 [Lachnospiraceae bacterium]|nr:hypothetical protein [Lachnospiraceae bacterium]
MKKNRLIAVLLSAFLLITIMMSYQLLIHDANHKCSGKDCPICREMENAADFINTIKAVPVAAAVIVLFMSFGDNGDSALFSRKFSNTLVSLKVELLN